MYIQHHRHAPMRSLAIAATLLGALLAAPSVRAEGEWFADIADDVDETLDLAAFRLAKSGSGDWVETRASWRKIAEKAKIARADGARSARFWTAVTWLQKGGGSAAIGGLIAALIAQHAGVPPEVAAVPGSIAGGWVGRYLAKRALDTRGADRVLSKMDTVAGELRGAITDIHRELKRDDGAVLHGKKRPSSLFWDKLAAAEDAIGELFAADEKLQRLTVVPKDEEHKLTSYYAARVRAGELESMLVAAIDAQMRSGRGDSWLRRSLRGGRHERPYDNLIDLISRVPEEQMTLDAVPYELRDAVDGMLGNPGYRRSENARPQGYSDRGGWSENEPPGAWEQEDYADSEYGFEEPTGGASEGPNLLGRITGAVVRGISGMMTGGRDESQEITGSETDFEQAAPENMATPADVDLDDSGGSRTNEPLPGVQRARTGRTDLTADVFPESMSGGQRGRYTSGGHPSSAERYSTGDRELGTGTQSGRHAPTGSFKPGVADKGVRRWGAESLSPDTGPFETGIPEARPIHRTDGIPRIHANTPGSGATQHTPLPEVGKEPRVIRMRRSARTGNERETGRRTGD